MTAINFPDSPTSNQVHTVDGRSWIWNGTTWDVVSRVVNVPATGPTGATGESADISNIFIFMGA